MFEYKSIWNLKKLFENIYKMSENVDMLIVLK